MQPEATEGADMRGLAGPCKHPPAFHASETYTKGFLSLTHALLLFPLAPVDIHTFTLSMVLFSRFLFIFIKAASQRYQTGFTNKLSTTHLCLIMLFLHHSRVFLICMTTPCFKYNIF